MDWRDEGTAGPSEVRRIDPEPGETPVDLVANDDDLFEDEHDGWQPVRRRSNPPPAR